MPEITNQKYSEHFQHLNPEHEINSVMTGKVHIRQVPRSRKAIIQANKSVPITCSGCW